MEDADYTGERRGHIQIPLDAPSIVDLNGDRTSTGRLVHKKYGKCRSYRGERD